MSGNIEVNGHKGQPLRTEHRWEWDQALSGLVGVLNKRLRLWGSKCLYDRTMFIGSTHAFLGASMSTKQLALYRSEFGDVDMAIPRNRVDDLIAEMNRFDPEKEICPTVGQFVAMGGVKANQNVSFILYNFTLGQTVQVDFCPIEFDGRNNPTPYSRWATTTDIDDIRWGLKGTIRNLLISAITRKDSADTREYLYSPFNGFKKIGMGDYVTHQRLVSELLFGTPGVTFDQLSSFHDVLTIMRAYLTSKQIDNVTDVFIKMMKEPKLITNDPVEDAAMRHKALTLYGLAV